MAIMARNLALTIGSTAILKGIDLDVASGETLALLGHSGSGKSSLMAVLAGLERASDGSLQVAGADFAALDEDALARARRGRIGIVLQAFHLLPTMTARENVATPLELAGEADAWARAGAELEAVGLGHRLDHYPAQLSGGEQQRVAVARALVTGPSILLADEPTGNLDSQTSEEIMGLLQSLNQSGITIVLVTHEPRIAAFTHRVVIVQDGAIADDRPVASPTGTEALA